MQDALLTPEVATHITRLTGHVLELPGKCKDIEPSAWLRKPAPGKWSKQEILGHLVDSALNNLKRFTEAQVMPRPYRMLPYQQDDLVQLNQYQQLPLDHIVQLWTSLNQQILYVLTNIPTEKLSWEVIIPNGESKTLSFWIGDYTDHLEHHWQQLFGPR